MKKYLWLAAAALLSAGIYFNEPRLVFGKAARICLECIGIG
ncbi:CD1871A family CXXC motif-containing protein [Schwartzia succinivorans]|nr:CD1871A family CXXC motif-containing protein [Schwartzia succinivorans]MBQ1470384.1 thioredoxin [Schwartzia sp. (in: firmicutes)]MBQ3862779.1 thioredoxin [Schwartzia sp. (in: firmicutes)]MDY6295163.1 CD1871A family CXXC motif-containing protein [Schwartzia succinivorans]